MNTELQEINYASLPDTALFEWPCIRTGKQNTTDKEKENVILLDLICFSPKVEPNFSRQLETVHTRTKVRI